MQNLEKLNELAQSLPEAVKANALALVEKMGEVIEGISDKPMEWRPSNLRVVQGTSDRSNLPKGATIGSMVKGEDVLESPYAAIPIRAYITRQKWNPDPEVKQIECQSPDGQFGSRFGKCYDCPHQKFDETTNKSACNKTYTVMAIAGDLSDVFVTNFSKSAYSSGLDWKKKMTTAGVAPFKRTYKLSTETSSKSKNVELLVANAFAGNTTDRELWPFLQELSDRIGTDRESALKAFYEYIESRKNNSDVKALENHGDDDSVVLLPSASGEEAETVVTVESTETTSSSKKYKL